MAKRSAGVTRRGGFKGAGRSKPQKNSPCLLKYHFKGGSTALINFTFWEKGNNLTNICHPLPKYVLAALTRLKFRLKRNLFNRLPAVKHVGDVPSLPRLPPACPPAFSRGWQAEPRKLAPGVSAHPPPSVCSKAPGCPAGMGFRRSEVKGFSRSSGSGQASQLTFCSLLGWEASGICTTAFRPTIAKTEGYGQRVYLNKTSLK